ncbi:hypothetical protein AVEN_71759-1 [Araneus ventricosus]|uniref:Uncharacterized protein n=1 Tax=Araneus ventricosus TaxID=182803 RepID=A0A4Y2TJF6_ARAVE|nr:hypothetical protein AVEN_145749-1 [Araneus ventricosus]GBO00362.1 hypothetical protein AVEN_71759-1 [Araneus ventricosus]
MTPNSPMPLSKFSRHTILSILNANGYNLSSSSLLSNPSDLNQIRSMRSFAFTSNTKSGRLSRSSYIKATQSSRCCGVASIMLHFVQILTSYHHERI